MKILCCSLILFAELTPSAQVVTSQVVLNNNSLERKLPSIEAPGVGVRILKEKEWMFHPEGYERYEVPSSFAMKGDPTHGPYGELKSTPLPEHPYWSYTTFYSWWNSPCGYAPCTVWNPSQPVVSPGMNGNSRRNYRKR